MRVPDTHDQSTAIKESSVVSRGRVTAIIGSSSRNVNKLLWKRKILKYFDGPYHRDFPLLSQNEGVTLKMDSCISKRNT